MSAYWARAFAIRARAYRKADITERNAGDLKII
jgi:hypothetical protein